MSDMSSLDEFEGRKVAGSTIKVTRAGDGLSSALAVAPVAYHRGDTVYAVLECEVGAITYKDSKEFPELLVREHTLVTQHGAIASGTAVAKILAQAKKEQAEFAAKEAERKLAEKGAVKLDGTDLDSVPKSKKDHLSVVDDDSE